MNKVLSLLSFCWILCTTTITTILWPPFTIHHSPWCHWPAACPGCSGLTAQGAQGGEDETTKFSLSPFRWILRTTSISPSSILYRFWNNLTVMRMIKLLSHRLESLYSPRSFDSTTSALDPFWQFPPSCSSLFSSLFLFFLLSYFTLMQANWMQQNKDWKFFISWTYFVDACLLLNWLLGSGSGYHCVIAKRIYLQRKKCFGFFQMGSGWQQNCSLL